MRSPIVGLLAICCRAHRCGRMMLMWCGGYLLMGLPHHTAVVYALNGSQVYVLHQNFGKKIVTNLNIRFANMTSGSVQAYRALPGR